MNMKRLIMTLAAITAGTGIAGDCLLNEKLDKIPSNAKPIRRGEMNVVKGRLKGSEALSLKNGASLEWTLPKVTGDCFIEFWFKPESWDALSDIAVDVCSFTIGGKKYQLKKNPKRSELTLTRGDGALFSYPIYAWKEFEWMRKHHAKGKENLMWHYVNIALRDRHLSLTIDAYPAISSGKAKTNGGLTAIRLGGGGASVFANLRVLAAAAPTGEDLRGRYRALYRGLPPTRKNTVTAPFLNLPPKLDGSLDDKAWRRAATIVGFTRVGWRNQPGHLIAEKVKAYIAYDERYLYLGIRTPYKGRLRAKNWKRWDAPLWGEESYEIFLHPPYTGSPDFCQLVGNTFGEQSDLKMLNRAWDGKWDWRTSVKDDVWTAEFRADFQGIDTPPPGDLAVWTMNILNTYACAGWCPTQRYNDSGSFGVLRFDKSAPIIRPDNFIVNEKEICVPLEIQGGAKRRRLDARLQVFGGKDVLPAREDRKKVVVGPGERRQLELRVDVEEVPTGKAVLIISDAADILYCQRFMFPVTPERVREPFPKDEKKAASVSETRAKSETPLSEEEKAYRRKWTASQLGETLLESSEWMDNELGRSDLVPKPWIPMRVDGQTIECWGRKYVYDSSSLPVQIISKDKPLLSAPMEFILSANGEDYHFRKAEVDITQVNDGLIDVVTISDSGPFRLKLKASYEFDGMAKMELSLSCPDDVSSVDALRMVVPLRAENVRYYQLTSSISGHAPSTNSDRMPVDGLRLNDFREVVWLGDAVRGFCWFAEGMKGWRLKNERSVQVVTPDENGTRELIVKMIEKPLTLERPWKIVFGVQATPNKPLPADFRQLADRSAIQWCWFWGEGHYYPFQSTFTDKAREHVAKYRKKGKEVMPCSSLCFYGRYHSQNAFFGANPKGGLMYRELMLWGPLWQRTTLPTRLPSVPEKHTAPGKWFDKKNEPSRLTSCCANSPWQDYYIWRLAQTIEETGLGAIYLDNPIYQCANEHHGCGYVDYKGEWRPSCPIFAMRNMVKRIYKLFHEAHGKSLIKWHSSNQYVPPILSFVDVFWDGENYGSGPHKVFEFYSETLSPGRMIAEHNTLKYGVASDLLPEFEERYAPSIASERDMMGLMMTHDTNCWPAHAPHPELIRHIQGLKLKYPLDEMKVEYYWDEDPRIRITSKDVVFIMFHKKDLALMVLFNWSGEAVKADVKLILRELGFAKKTAVIKDVENEEIIGSEDGKFSVPLLPRDFRMLELKSCTGGSEK